MSLFFKECKKVIFSLTFVMYVIVVFAMYSSQYGSDKEALVQPREGMDDYGTIAKEVPEILMPKAIEGLVNEYLSGNFTAYPIGFYKNVKLNEKKSKELCDIIYELSGLTKEQLDSFDYYKEGGMELAPDGFGGFAPVFVPPEIPEINIPEELSYERFRELMRQADKIIGGGSNYSDDYIVGHFSRIPMTYEDALDEYNAVIYEEKISPAYARLFCDYSCIDLAIMPVFVAAALAGKDKKSRIEQLIYSRKISSARLVLTRFAALIAVMLIPVICMVIHAQAGVCEIYKGYEIDMLAFAKYSAMWLLPNVLLASAVGMLLTEIFSPIIAIFVQGAWWFGGIFASAGGLTGSITSFVLVPRHNSLYNADQFAETFRQFAFNRIFYTVLAFVLLAVTVIVYEIKRRGGFNGLFGNGKNSLDKSAA
ncbi:MAG: ABC transporter permease [Oscillospiraceae bacterium]|nr:ABC transporter permease [Oscillospiraceae bacterium]